MLSRAVRPLVLARTPLYRLSMSADQAPKRAHSTSPPPPASPSAVPPTAVESAAAKRVKLTVEEPASVPPNLIETPIVAGKASTSEPAKKKEGTSNGKPAPASGNKPKRIKTANGKRFKVKPPKPGGAEEAAAFDIIELLGQAKVEELKQKEVEGWSAYNEAVKEWGKDKEGKDLEVRVAGISDHGASFELVFSFRWFGAVD